MPEEVRVVALLHTRMRWAAVIKFATKWQPSAGQGKGSVRTHDQPVWSGDSSSSQSSSSVLELEPADRIGHGSKAR